MEVTPFKTKVKVLKNVRADNGKFLRLTEIHKGLVVQDTGSFLRVWNPEEENSATAPEYAELFAKKGKDLWCEIIEEPIVKKGSAAL
jgi:hypothetical protein